VAVFRGCAQIGAEMAKVLKAVVTWYFFGGVIILGGAAAIGAGIAVAPSLWSAVSTIAGQVVVGILIAAAILSFVRHISH
jgi:hypothetical protein